MRKEHFSRKSLKFEDKAICQDWIVVVNPQWQCVEDKHRIKTVCFRNRRTQCKQGDGALQLHRFRWEERMCSLDCRLERRVPPGGIATVVQEELQKQLWEDTLLLPHQPRLLSSPISCPTQPSGRATQVLPVLWQEKRRHGLTNE